MIVIDLDGTLLTSDKNISNYTLSILDKYKNNGIKNFVNIIVLQEIRR